MAAKIAQIGGAKVLTMTTMTTMMTTMKTMMAARARLGFARTMTFWALAMVCAFAASIAITSAAAAATVQMQTSKGDIVLEIDEEGAPQTAANFLQYVNDGFYDGLIFHRVIAGFVIQGGGFMPGMQKREPRAPIAFENTGLKNLQYSISMARRNDPNSATSQFFINLKDTPYLDGDDFKPGYAVFGKVVEGMEIVEEIAKAETRDIRSKGIQGLPLEDIVIIKAEVQGQEEQTDEGQQQEDNNNESAN